MKRKIKQKNTLKGFTLLASSSLLLLVCLLIWFSAAQASITKQINYQGKLTNSSSWAVPDGNYDMRFKIYDAVTDGTLLWTGTHTAANGNAVSVSNGIFSVQLGSGTGNALNLDFSGSSGYWLQVEIYNTNTTTWETFSPRKPMVSVPQAFNANNVIGDGRIDVTTTDNSNASLKVTQSGTGDIVNVMDGASEVFTILDGGNVGINSAGPDRRLDVLDATNPQMRLTYTDGSVYTDLQTTSAGELYINPSGSNVGIGTNDPSSRLSVINDNSSSTYGTLSVGNGAAQGGGIATMTRIGGQINPNLGAIGLDIEPTISATTGFDFRGIYIQQTVGGSATVNGKTVGLYLDNPVITGTSASRYSIYSANTDQSYFAGSIGINTTGPDRKLDVLDATNPQLRLTYTDGAVYTDMQTTSSGYLYLNPSGTNIGIGDSTPAANLVVGSDAGAGYANGAGDVYIQNDLEVDGTIYGTVSGTINPGFTTGSVVFQGASGLSQDNTNFFWNDTDNRLGIGTNGPDRKLDVLDATNPQLRLSQTDGTTYADFQMNSSGDLVLNVDGRTNQLVLDDGGNVGIGTAAPGSLLSVAGTADINGTLDMNGAIDLDVTVNDYAMNIYNPSTGTSAGGLYIRSDGTGNLLALNSNGTDIMTITAAQTTINNPVAMTSAGDVSIYYDLYFNNATASYIKFQGPGYIQTESPSQNLNLTLSAANAGKVIVDDNLESYGTALFQNPTNSTTAYQFLNAAGTNIVDVDTTNGRLGVGTTTPHTPIEIYTATGTAAYLRVNQNAWRSWDVGIDAGTSTFSIKDSSGRLPFQIQYQATSNLMYLDGLSGSGRVGVNTSGPDRTLDVLDATNPQLRLTQTDGTTYADFQMNSSGDMVMNVDGVSNQLVLDDGGKVGIGTNAPGAYLDVSLATNDATTMAMQITGTGTGAQNWQLYPSTDQTLILMRPGLRLAGFGNDGSFFAGGLGGGTGSGADLFVNGTTGYIGMGDVTPAANLVVGVDTTAGYANGAGDVYIQNDLEVDGTIYGNISGTINPGFTTGSVIFQGAAGLAQDNANFYWNDTDNRLGIGTSPSYPLDVNGDINIASSAEYRIGTTQVLSKGNGSLSGNLIVGNGGGALTHGADQEGYWNTSVGLATFGSNTTGAYNTSMGSSTFNANTTGNANNAFGYGALGHNVSGSNNVALGVNSLLYNETGSNNIAIGHAAGAGVSTNSYSNNTIIGYSAGYLTTTGSNNFFGGYQAGYTNATGTDLVFLGYQAGYNNTANYGTFIGYQAGYTNSTGEYNTAVGVNALRLNSTGTANSAFGSAALNNTTGGYNSGFGNQALYNNTSGINNSAFGQNAGLYTQTGSNNTLIGYNAGYGVIGNSYSNNTMIGYQSGFATTTGGNNFIGGYQAGYANTTGNQNVILGVQAGYSNQTGTNNVFLGYTAGYSTTAGYNTFVGNAAGYSNTSAIENVAVGHYAGFYNQTGADNVLIGKRAGFGVTGNSYSFNTYVGSAAGLATTTGSLNVFLGGVAGASTTTGSNNFYGGYGAGYYNQTGISNVLLGYQSGFGVTGNSHSNNTFIGYQTGFSTTTGGNNFFGGYQAGYTNATGANNVIIGKDAGYLNTNSNNVFVGMGTGYNNTGDVNTFIGYYTGNANTSGRANAYLGYNAGFNNQTGSNNTLIGNMAGNGVAANSYSNNTFIGYQTGYSTTTGGGNFFGGYQAGYLNATGANNTFIGYQSGYANTASYGTFLGVNSGKANTTGSDNTFIGTNAGLSNTEAINSVFLGSNAGRSFTTGGYNVAIGYGAGYSDQTGQGNVFLGYQAGYNETGSNKLYIDNSNSATPLLYGDFSTDTLVVNSTLGVNTSGPDRKLDVLDASNPQLRLTYTDGSVYTDMQTTSVGELYINPSGGNVGIGTSDPGYALEVNGHVKAQSFYGSGAGAFYGISFGSAGYWDSNVTLASYTGKSVLINPSGGNVGIGDSSPAANLVVGSDTAAGYANGAGDAYIQNDLEVDGTIYGNISGTINPGLTAGSVIFQGASGLAQDNSNFFWNDTDNRLGIGTNGPDRALDVLDATNPQLRLTQADGTVYADFQMNSSGDLVTNVDGVTNQLVLDNGGNVGIGTAAPTSKVSILNSGSNPALSVQGAQELTYSSELLPNPNFDTADNWTFTNGASWSASEGGTAVVPKNGTVTSTYTSFDVGAVYKLVLTASPLSNGEYYYPITIAGWGPSYYVAVSPGSPATLYFRALNTNPLVINRVSDSTGTLTSVSLTKVTQYYGNVFEVNDSTGTPIMSLLNGAATLSNTFIGASAGASTVVSYNNIGIGKNALKDGFSNQTWGNTVIGVNALSGSGSSTDLSRNTIIGASAYANGTYSAATAIGYNALGGAGNAYMSVAIGSSAASSGSPQYSTMIGADVGGGASYSTQVGYRAGKNNNSSGTKNVQIGGEAALTNSSGANSVVIGYQAGYYNQTGGSNVSIGYQSGGYGAGVANSFSNNTYMGYQSGYSTTTGGNNLALGYQAGYSSQTGAGNVFLGYQAGYSETGSNKLYIDNSNTATPLIYGDFSSDTLAVNGTLGVNTTGPDRRLDVLDASNPQLRLTYTDGSVYTDLQTDGSGYLYLNASGNRVGIEDSSPSYTLDVAGDVGIADANEYYIGSTQFLSKGAGSLTGNLIVGDAGASITAGGTGNTAVGLEALDAVTTGANNVAMGYQALTTMTNPTNGRTVAIGAQALRSVTSGDINTALGYGAGYFNQTGSYNVLVGGSAGYGASTNSYSNNTYVGYQAGFTTYTGGNNLALGYQAGYTNQYGTGNVFIGYQAGYNETGSSKLYVDDSNTATPLIYGDFSTDAMTVYGTQEVDTGTSGIALTLDQDDIDATALDFDVNNVSGDILNMDWGGSTTLTGVLQPIDIDLTNVTADGTNAVYGMHLNDPAALTASAEYGIYVQGTNWDYSIVTEGDVLLNGSGAELVIRDSDNTHSGTIDVGSLSSDAVYTLAGPTGNILTSTTEPTLTDAGRHTRATEFKPEFAGAVLTKFYGTSTETSYTGTMTSDTEGASPFHNYYNWTSGEAALNGYTVSFTAALPSDFDSWTTSNAMQLAFKTTTASSADQEFDVYVYDSAGTLVASSTGNVSATWTTVNFSAANLSGWSSANSTAFVYIRMRAKSSNVVKAGEIKLNYLSKW